jgi:hypothetical protein
MNAWARRCAPLPTLRLIRSSPTRQYRDQPQHATRTLTVGDPIKVKAGFDFSAAASSASAVALRGSLRSHLRVTEHWQRWPLVI